MLSWCNKRVTSPDGQIAMMTAEVINIQVKQESSSSSDTSHQNTNTAKVSEPDENGVQGSEETTSQVETVPQAVLVQAATTVDNTSVSASEQLQRMIQQQYLVNLIQFQQSMLQVKNYWPKEKIMLSVFNFLFIGVGGIYFLRINP